MTDDDTAEARSWRFRWVPGSDQLRNQIQSVAPRVKAGIQVLRRGLRTSEGKNIQERIEGIDEEFVEEGAQSVTESDVDTVVERADAIEERFRKSGPLRRLLEDGRLLLGMVQDVREGRYRSIPLWSLSAAAFALLYVLNPLDVVPDALPLLGVVDDAAVVSACLKLLEQDLHEYRKWRRETKDRGSVEEENSEDGGKEPPAP